jgi:hypothetical protein
MSRGHSGRIVLEIDTDIKDQLYIALASDKLTLKDWFLGQCRIYLSDRKKDLTYAAERKYSYPESSK